MLGCKKVTKVTDAVVRKIRIKNENNYFQYPEETLRKKYL